MFMYVVLEEKQQRHIADFFFFFLLIFKINLVMNLPYNHSWSTYQPKHFTSSSVNELVFILKLSACNQD